MNDPANKQAKIASKDHLLGEILGYQPQTLVSIEYLPDLGDWKTAWDHIHFAGFLGVPMTLQFIWQGCDSVLAAPLVLGPGAAHRVGPSPRPGRPDALPGQFFQEPLRRERARFDRQFQMLEEWARSGDDEMNGTQVQRLLFTNAECPPQIREHTSSTFADNMKLPVHRWFRFSAGFGADWAEQTIRSSGSGRADEGSRSLCRLGNHAVGRGERRGRELRHRSPSVSLPHRAGETCPAKRSGRIQAAGVSHVLPTPSAAKPAISTNTRR